MYVRRVGMTAELLAVYGLSWGEGAIHAADPATAEPSKYTRDTYYRALCGLSNMRTGGVRPFRQTMKIEHCGTCEKIADRRYPEGAPNPHEAAIRLLEDLLASLPKDHHERPGIIRSVEVLRVYG